VLGESLEGVLLCTCVAKAYCRPFPRIERWEVHSIYGGASRSRRCEQSYFSPAFPPPALVTAAYVDSHKTAVFHCRTTSSALQSRSRLRLVVLLTKSDPRSIVPPATINSPAVKTPTIHRLCIPEPMMA